jgi:ribonuclease VapC
VIGFVDASVLVAILAEEDDYEALAEQVDLMEHRMWSAMSCWEAISALRRSHEYPIERARAEVQAYADMRGLELVPIGSAEMTLALDAYQRFGRGSGSLAKLNMGDCFAYACAKANDARLLYKGSDFLHTDLA